MLHKAFIESQAAQAHNIGCSTLAVRTSWQPTYPYMGKTFHIWIYMESTIWGVCSICASMKFLPKGDTFEVRIVRRATIISPTRGSQR